MSDRIGLINYGIAGNIKSIEKALARVGAKTIIVNSPEQMDKVDKIVLPGVGSFPDAMRELTSAGFVEILKHAIDKKPTLGICLGMQILSRIGFEYGQTSGLGVFDAEVKPILCDAAVPHMGFSKVNVEQDSSIMKGLDGCEFYFMHSFEVVNYKNILTLSTYANHEFVSGIFKDHIFGVQFHPEKSRDQGLELFKNFSNI